MGSAGLKPYDNVPLAGARRHRAGNPVAGYFEKGMQMKKRTIGSLIIVAVGGLVTAGILAQDRVNIGKVQVADERQTLDRGRLGSQESMPSEPLILNGTLVDGNCRDRSQANLTRPPIPLNQYAPAETSELAATEDAARAKTGYATATKQPDTGGISAYGITVDPQTLEQEQAEVLQHQVPDLITRQDDLTCGVTARTSNFAFLMDNGRLLDLNAGGNAWAWQAIQSSSAGQAMLEGKGPAVKLQATVRGIIRGDQVRVDSLTLR